MSVKGTIQAIPAQIFDASTLTGTYQVVYSSLPEACFMIRIVNDSEESITLSYDGVTDHDYVVTNTSIQLPFQTNAQPNNFKSLLGKGISIYAKGGGGPGNLVIIGYYQPVQS